MNPRRSRRRCKGDDGQFAGIEVLPFSLLIFVVGSLVVANAWAVIDAKLMVTTAAREAARAYVESPDRATALAASRERADEVARGHGRRTDRLDLTWKPSSPPFARCARVTAVATYRVPALTLPFVGSLGQGFHVVSQHSESVDPFRSGLEGVADCA